MTDSNLAPLAAVPPPPSPFSRRRRAERAAWALGAVAVLSGVGIWLGWSAQQRLQALESELVKRQQASQNQAQEARLLAKQAEELARESAARSTLLETRLAEVVLQRGQIDELVKVLSRSQAETLLVDLEATLRVASQQASLTGSAEPVVSALQAAAERLARTQQPRLDAVRRAVARDLDRIKSTRVSDLPALAIRVDEAIRLVDDAPLLSQPHERQAPAAALSPESASPASSPASAGAPWAEQVLRWGRQASKAAWQEARTLVRLTRIDRPEAVLLAPDQTFFLRENLKLRLLNARLNLISRQNGAATEDLRSVQAAVTRYFDPESRKTQLLRSLLSEVIAQSPHTHIPKPDDTLAALTTLSAAR